MYLNTYAPSVRIGNWNEDVSLEEEQLKDFLYKKERGELLVQKKNHLKINLLKKTDLSITVDGLLHIGDVVMLRNPGSERLNLNSIDPPQDQSTLVITPDESAFSCGSSLKAPCGVSANKNLVPSVRSAFVITSVDGSPPGEILRYGQKFAFRTTEGFAGQLYLSSDHKSFQKSAKKSRLQEVNLTDHCSYLCFWEIVYFDPQLRLEYEGYPVPANAKVLINHCKTGHCLAVLGKYILWTEFGKEYEVTAHTHLDSHKAERDVNIWYVVTGNPHETAPTILERPAPLPTVALREKDANDQKECSKHEI
ncbi:cilia- and flagella-associated protein 161 [Latimeria chalumnae]|uniref:Cilia and flagella associated protein 161 n=1 Tax=Latimeria chalumnae TaxID=7897 RepID=H3B0U1_LATCH|nr:PREDICTED: uncharacterized protein C15orf26 homolog isoform X2 [Latimeria chalumnae]|eukprot:XP_005989662.1 PREDICTED: uncharacterized protein C15orf26 homolog isoform X2 [Latimeria chalumnae]